MNITAQLSSQKNQRPILIVDKRGIIGGQIAKKLSENFIIILVSKEEILQHPNIIHVPFSKKIPSIPDNYYSHIFLVDGETIVSESISSFVKKATMDDCNLVLIQSIKTDDEKSFDEVKAYKKGQIIFFADLFSEEFILNNFGKDLASIKKTRKIEVENDGLETIRPVYLNDFIEKFIEQIFVRENTNKIINLFPRAELTKLSFSRIVQSIDPLIKTDFVKDKTPKEKSIIKEGDFVLEEYDLKKSVKDFLEKENPQDFKEEDFSQEIGERSYLRGAILFLFIFIIFFIFLPLITTYAYAGLGVYELSKVKSDFEKGSINSSLESAKKAQTFFSFAQKTLVPLKTEARIIRQEDRYFALEQKINSGEKLSEATISIADSAEKIRTVLSGDSKDPSGDFSKTLALLKESISDFESINVDNQIPQIKEKMSEVSPVVSFLSSSIDILPQALAFDKEKKYLVLFQNNMELRPGGGFIGSYGILDIKEGRIKDFKIDDVYNPDGQLKGHVEPPFPIRRFLPQPNWFLRDSNFDIDFKNNASEAAYFFGLETGEEVDGVLGIDVNVLKNILEVTGPVEVSDYDVSLNSDNFYDEVQKNAQKDFFPGSKQKKNFLTAVFKSITQKLSNPQKTPYLSLLKIVKESLSTKDILLSSSDSKLQKELEINGWAGTADVSSKISGSSINDIFGISEANLGINKVNYLISRTVSKAEMVDPDGTVSSTATISYKNDSQSLNYKNYLRIILPSNITIKELSFDNVLQQMAPAVTDPAVFEAKGFKPPTGVEIDQKDDGSKTIVGFLVNIPPSSIKSISLTYEQKESLILGDTISYGLSYIKQPGTSEFPFDLSFYFPQDYKMLKGEKGTTKTSEKIDLQTSIEKDEDFEFLFSKK